MSIRATRPKRQTALSLQSNGSTPSIARRESCGEERGGGGGKVKIYFDDCQIGITTRRVSTRLCCTVSVRWRGRIPGCRVSGSLWCSGSRATCRSTRDALSDPRIGNRGGRWVRRRRRVHYNLSSDRSDRGGLHAQNQERSEDRKLEKHYMRSTGEVGTVG